MTFTVVQDTIYSNVINVHNFKKFWLIYISFIGNSETDIYVW